MTTRHDWSISELQELYDRPLFSLMAEAHRIHGDRHTLGEIQVCHLISIKTGGCPEDCRYCSQSAHYKTPVTATPMMTYDEVLADARKAIGEGASRICLGAAQREVRSNKQFDEVLRMIQGIREMGAEVCCTLGMLKAEYAQQLKEAGLYAYNHNLDTSESFYPSIITTRCYQDRLNTLTVVEEANLSVCCGGILGMGEAALDRLQLLHTLCTRNPHPESVPINRLSPIPGTPLENLTTLSIWEMLRIISIARIVLPKAMIRLSAGRVEMTYEAQALCFFAGANSLFAGSKLLTVGNNAQSEDEELFRLLGLTKRPAYAHVS
jgi:biotin synthase